MHEPAARDEIGQYCERRNMRLAVSRDGDKVMAAVLRREIAAAFSSYRPSDSAFAAEADSEEEAIEALRYCVRGMSWCEQPDLIDEPDSISWIDRAIEVALRSGADSVDIGASHHDQYVVITGDGHQVREVSHSIKRAMRMALRKWLGARFGPRRTVTA